MEMMCPHCGLKGKAEQQIIGKKIRCPQCKEVFRVSEELALQGSPQQTGGPAAIQENNTDIQENNTTEENNILGETISDDEIVLTEIEEKAETTVVDSKTCSKCGYDLDVITEESDNATFCSLCGHRRPAGALAN